MKNSLTFIDFCAGVGGFRQGLTLAGHTPIGFCEKDKFAVKSYRAMYGTDGEWFENDIKQINPRGIPNADLWCFGFPCQDISVAGKQGGLDGERSGIYFKIINLIKGKSEEDKPKYLLIENVKNLLSVNRGWDFARVLLELDEAGYDAEWQVLNSKDFGVPQNRERVYIVGHLRSRGGRKILPVGGENSSTLKQLVGGSQGNRVYAVEGTSCTLKALGGGQGAKTGLYLVKAVLTPDRLNKRQNGRRMKDSSEPMFTITSQDRHGVAINNRIRRLTPRECFRLQGFSDELFCKASEVNSDAQLYKQAGNAVTVNVIYTLGLLLG